MSDADVTVTLDMTDADPEDVSAVARQIPEAIALGPRTTVTVLPTAVCRGGLLRRLLGDARVPVARATRCTALLVRGYVGLGADAGRAWGITPD
jgi:hypothetical protein